MGYEALAAAELEFRFFRETQMSLRDKDFGPNLTPLNPGFNCYAISQASADEHVLGRIARMMRDQGIEIEAYNREHGQGMYEMTIGYADAVAAGDKTMLFKTGAKELCHQLGLTVTGLADGVAVEAGIERGQVGPKVFVAQRHLGLAEEAELQ